MATRPLDPKIVAHKRAKTYYVWPHNPGNGVSSYQWYCNYTQPDGRRVHTTADWSSKYEAEAGTWKKVHALAEWVLYDAELEAESAEADRGLAAEEMAEAMATALEEYRAAVKRDEEATRALIKARAAVEAKKAAVAQTTPLAATG